MSLDTILIAGILIWDVWHGWQTLKEQRRAAKVLENFLSTRADWYARRNRQRANVLEGELLRPEPARADDGERELLQPLPADGGAPDVAAVAAIADMQEEDLRGGHDN